jgi:hypothetical protein
MQRQQAITVRLTDSAKNARGDGAFSSRIPPQRARSAQRFLREKERKAAEARDFSIPSLRFLADLPSIFLK